jgi:hypothetical protein
MTINNNLPHYGNPYINASTFDDLRSVSTKHLTDGYSAIVAGAFSPADGLGGLFAWNPLSTLPHDGETVIAPSDGQPGRWTKVAVGQVGPRGAQGLKGDIGLKGEKGEPGDGLATVMASGGSALVGYSRPVAGARPMSVAEKLSQTWHFAEWLPAGYVKDGSVDYSANLQSAMNALAAAGGGVLRIPQGTFKVSNITFTNQVVLEGVNMRETILRPASNAHQFKVPANSSLVRFGLRNMWLWGDSTIAPDKDGVNIAPTAAGTFNDTIYLQDITITNQGRAGLWMEGTSAEGPFVQRVYLNNVEIANNGSYNIRIKGAVIEATTIQSSICGANILDGSGASVLLSPHENGVGPARISFYTTIFNNPLPNRAGVYSPAVRVEAGTAVGFWNSSFEECGIGIDIVKARSVGVFLTDFANGGGVMEAAVKVANCDGLAVIKPNVFGQITNVVHITGNTLAVPMPLIDLGSFSAANIVNTVADDFAGRQEIIAGNIRASRKQIALVGESNLDDQLYGLIRYANSSTGSSGLYDGQEITLTRWANTGTITVKHGTGNLHLANGQDFVLGSANTSGSITFQYSADRAVWIEKSRSSAVGAVVIGVSTVAGLPTASANNRGWRATVTDAGATTFLSTVAGGGTNVVPIFSNGSAWIIG